MIKLLPKLKQIIILSSLIILFIGQNSNGVPLVKQDIKEEIKITIEDQIRKTISKKFDSVTFTILQLKLFDDMEVAEGFGVTTVVFILDGEKKQSIFIDKFKLKKENNVWKVSYLKTVKTEIGYNTDIIHHNLKVFIDIDNYKFEVCDKLKIRNISLGFPFLNFYLNSNFTLNSIKVNDTNLDYKRITDRVFIPFDQFNNDYQNILEIEINYSFIDENFKKKFASQIEKSKENFPFYASYLVWVPQERHGGATAKITYILQKDISKKIKVVGDGEFVKIKEKRNQRHFIWEVKSPTSNLSFAIGYYSIKSHKFKNLSITTCLFPENIGKAKELVNRSYDIIQYFSSLFVNFPYQHITIIEVPDEYSGEFIEGAINLGTAILVRKSQLEFTKEQEPYFFFFCWAHEISHFWTRIAGGNFRKSEDEWLAEGLAEYSSYLFANEVGKIYANEFIRRQAFEYLEFINHSQDTPIINAVKGEKDAIIYKKGHYIAYMLHNLIGDNNFFKVLKNYFDRYKDKDATISDFKKVCEEVHQKNLNWFFNQWFYKTGAPKFDLKDIEVNETKGGYKVKAILYQDGDIFKCPVEVELITFDEERKREIFMISKKERPIFFKCKSKPKSLIVDPDWKILKLDNHIIVPLYKKAQEEQEIGLLNTSLGEGFYNRAKEYFEKEEYDKAEYWLKEAIKINPNYADAYNGLGLIYMKKQLIDAAITMFKKAIEVDSNCIKARNNLAKIYSDKGLIAKAIMGYEKALEMDPMDINTYMDLASFYLNNKLNDQSICILKRALKIEPNSAAIHLFLGMTYSNKELYHKAIEEFKKVLEITPNQPAGYFFLATQYERLEEKEKAIFYLEKYIELNPGEKEIEKAKEHIKKLKGE